MLILGLLLVVVSAAGAILLVGYNSSGGPEQTIVLFGRDLMTVTPLQAFLAGIAIGLVFCLGLWMLITTEHRRRVARTQAREARREAKAAHREAQAATRERDELAEQLAREREREAAGTTTSTEPQRTAERPPADPPAGETTPPRGIGRHFRRRRTENAAAANETAQPRHSR
jgi:ABC-type nickel/cobalt efflux system permease component RcnA